MAEEIKNEVVEETKKEPKKDDKKKIVYQVLPEELKNDKHVEILYVNEDGTPYKKKEEKKKARKVQLTEGRSANDYYDRGRETFGLSKIQWWLDLEKEMTFLFNFLKAPYDGNCKTSIAWTAILFILGFGGFAAGIIVTLLTSTVYGIVTIVVSLIALFFSHRVWHLWKRNMVYWFYNCAELYGLNMKTADDNFPNEYASKKERNNFMELFCKDVNYLCECYNHGKKAIFQIHKIWEIGTSFLTSVFRPIVSPFERFIDKVKNFFNELKKSKGEIIKIKG